jgi:hypothetical protein
MVYVFNCSEQMDYKVWACSSYGETGTWVADQIRGMVYPYFVGPTFPWDTESRQISPDSFIVDLRLL